jgi:hypothetical protein
MPFTPFHMGPGLLIKSFIRQYFSLMIYGFSQVAMDTEVLFHMFRRDQILHSFNHTYLGATLVAIISIFIGRPICQFLLNRWIPDVDSSFEKWIRGPQNISWIAAMCGAFLGTYSHVLLDSIMHFDLRPLMPWSPDNSLLGAISVDGLHLICIGSAFLGVIILLSLYYFRRSRANKVKYD